MISKEESADDALLIKPKESEKDPMAVIQPNENTKKLKALMRQLSEQSPTMNGNGNSLARRYTKIFTVVALYW